MMMFMAAVQWKHFKYTHHRDSHIPTWRCSIQLHRAMATSWAMVRTQGKKHRSNEHCINISLSISSSIMVNHSWTQPKQQSLVAGRKGASLVHYSSSPTSTYWLKQGEPAGLINYRSHVPSVSVPYTNRTRHPGPGSNRNSIHWQSDPQVINPPSIQPPMEVSEHAGTPNHPKLDHFSIETYGFGVSLF